MSEKLTETVRVRFTKEEYDTLARMAVAMNMSISAVVRYCAISWITYTTKPLIEVLKPYSLIIEDNNENQNIEDQGKKNGGGKSDE